MYRSLLGLMLGTVLVQSLVAQERHGIGVHFGGYDYFGPQTGTYFMDSRTLNNGDKKNQLYWDPAIRVSYWNRVHRLIELSAALSLSQIQYPGSSKDSSFIKSKTVENAYKQSLPLTALEVRGSFHFFDRDRYIASPFVSLGASIAFQNNQQIFSAPVGLGLMLRLAPQTYLDLETQYHLAQRTHLFHSLGIVYRFGGKKEKVIAPPPPPVVLDADNDGTPDASDECPNLPGRRETKGCPDADMDGIVDKLDDCPNQAGLPQFRGCPDTDGDGLSDKQDACPTVVGISKYKGCPVPDRDQDGFNDEVDACPDEASSVNKGCPEVAQEIVEQVVEAAKGVFFEKNKAILSKESFDNLDQIAEVLKKNPELNVDIEGHTDNTGSAERNAYLSQQRADVCKNYLVKKGIAAERITSTGYGDMKPIATNDTEEGRAQNRRTEFILSK